MKVSIQNITKEYENKRVLDIPQHCFSQGKITGIVGVNGAGKSTLIRILGGLEEPSQGQVFYNGDPEFEKYYREITLVFQHPYLLSSSVYHNIAYPLKVRKWPRKDIQHCVKQTMQELDIEHLRDQRATTLSGGERQKVALARAGCFNPSLLLLDEPTANIDPHSIQVLESYIKKLNREKGTTIIIVTHNMEQAQRLCDERITMEEGRIIEFTRREGCQ